RPGCAHMPVEPVRVLTFAQETVTDGKGPTGPPITARVSTFRSTPHRLEIMGRRTSRTSMPAGRVVWIGRSGRRVADEVVPSARHEGEHGGCGTLEVD